MLKQRAPMKRSAPLRRSTGEATLTVPAFRPKVCSVKKGGCGARFTPTRQMQVACSVDCAYAVGMQVRLKQDKAADRDFKAAARAERKRLQARKDAIKPLSHWLKLTEKVMNTYVRWRDHADGCISCDKPATWGGQWHASHFRSVGAAKQLRYHLWNIHKACSQCNDRLSGNIAAYTPRIVQKIGAERVEWLNNNHALANYSVEYLARMRKVFAKKTHRLQKRLGI